MSVDTVLGLIRLGLRYKEIAVRLNCTHSVVKHRSQELRAQGHHFVPKRREVFIEGLKKCRCCEIPKGEGEFYKSVQYPDGTSSWCKDCISVGNRAKRYGITREQVIELLRGSGTHCPICGEAYSATLPPVIDHSHEKGVVRSVICLLCNHALGRIKDSLNTAKGLVRYLEAHQ